MKKQTIILFAILFVIVFTPYSVLAQGMMGNSINGLDTETAKEEAEGKAIFEKLQAKQVQCSDLTDSDFELLGDYYMGQMMGNSHATMDNLMTQRIGENNNRLMHIALGKRLSSCDGSASFPLQGTGFLPMMGMMGNWPSYDSNSNYNQPNNFNSMMGFGYGYGSLGAIFMIFFWVLVILAVVMLVSWLVKQTKSMPRDNGSSALDILKERYAKGEINKEEFKEKKKDLNV